MHQHNAFSALLAVALAEANKVNARAQAAEMSHLHVSMLIAAGDTAEALTAGQQVFFIIMHSTARIPGDTTLQACATLALSHNNVAACEVCDGITGTHSK